MAAMVKGLSSGSDCVHVFCNQHSTAVMMAPLGFYCFHKVVSACPSPSPPLPCRSAMFNILIIVALSALLAGKVSSSAAQSPHPTHYSPPTPSPTTHTTAHSPTP